MDCNQCKDELNAKLSAIPSVWRRQIINVLCKSQEESEITCDDVKDCETLTNLSNFTIQGEEACITYKDENGVSSKRCLSIEGLFQQLLGDLDPKCMATDIVWDGLTAFEKIQLIIDVSCNNTITTSTTSTTSTSSTSSTTTTTTSGTTTTTTTVAQFTAYWGWKDTITAPSSGNIISAAQGSGNFSSGSSIFADYTANGSPKFLWMAEPSTQPAKTKWDGDGVGVLNQGDVGGASGSTGNLFASPQIIGSFRYYITEYLTQNNANPIEFKIS